jgi:hypothetical protein
MRVLRDSTSINKEIHSCPDPLMAQLLASHLEFVSEYPSASDSITAFMVEPGDTLEAIDIAMDHRFLSNHYSGRRLGDPAFVPCFETLEDHGSFYEMFFIEGDDGIAMLIPKRQSIDPRLLAICAAHATPCLEQPS